jgi:hypothetical protein
MAWVKNLRCPRCSTLTVVRMCAGEDAPGSSQSYTSSCSNPTCAMRLVFDAGVCEAVEEAADDLPVADPIYQPGR